MSAITCSTMWAGVVLALLCSAEGFFLYSNKKTSTERVMPPPQYFREQQIQQVPQVPWGQQYAFDGTGPVTVALPVAVPIQAQMAPIPSSLKGTVHNVQLVPCLCPVSKDMDSPYASSYMSSMAQQQQVQQQQQQQSQQSQASYIVQPNQPQTTT